MKYKVGDKVRIKSLDWYNQNKDKDNNVPLIKNTNSYYNFIEAMRGLCGKVMTISSVNSYYYDMVEDYGDYFWTDEMIEGIFAEETKPLVFGDSLECPQGYQFVDENGNIINATKIVLEKKKKEYPKTHEECCQVLGIEVRDFTVLYNMLDTSERIYSNNLDGLLHTFRKLLICRDAYWKIAEDWRPEFRFGKKKYCIMTKDNKVISATVEETNRILAFPTEEMRDAFYENFKELIEQCKELL